jgi:hypothetical protein
LVQSPAASFFISTSSGTSRRITIYRLASNFASATKVGHLRSPIPGYNGFDDAFALDANHLWLGFVDIERGGSPSFLERSADGGAHWRRGPFVGHDFHAGSADNVTFTTPEDGWQMAYSLVAEFAKLLHTDDAGAHWSPVASNRSRQRIPLAEGSVTVTPDGGLWQLPPGWFVPETRLMHSTDGGRDWVKIAAPPGFPQGADVDTLSQVDGVLLMPFFVPAGRHRGRFGVLSYRDGRWSRSSTLTLRGTAATYDDMTIAVSGVDDWIIRPDVGPHPRLLTTENSGRSWTVHRVPRRVDGKDDDSPLTAEPGGSALLINDYSAPSANGPWRRVRFVH